MYPKFKIIYTPTFSSNGTLYIGLDGNLIEIPDEDGSVSKLLELLDGTNSIEDIAKVLNISLDDTNEAIMAFDEYGLIEDANADTYGLNNEELDRYRVNLNYFSTLSNLENNKYSFQSKLNNSSLSILGLGGSSTLAATLVGMGIGKITGLDYDKVELSNLNRQFISNEDDIGRLKIDVMSEKLKKINPNTELKLFNLKVTDAKCLQDVIKDSDIVVNGIDRPAIQSTRWVNSACVQLRKPYIQGGIGNNSIMLQKYVPGCGCFDCFLINSIRNDELFEHQIKSAYGEMFEKRNTSFGPNVMTLNGFISAEIAKHLLDYGSPINVSLAYEFDSKTMERREPILWAKQNDCPTCGKKHDGYAITDEIVSLYELIAIAKRR
jgi:molybdopterin/thiamine biosynthesis adenylyltransferase